MTIIQMLNNGQKIKTEVEIHSINKVTFRREIGSRTYTFTLTKDKAITVSDVAAVCSLDNMCFKNLSEEV